MFLVPFQLLRRYAGESNTYLAYKRADVTTEKAVAKGRP